MLCGTITIDMWPCCAALRKASGRTTCTCCSGCAWDNPEGAVNLAKTVAKQPGPPIDLNTMADMFLQRNMVREATAFLLEVLQDNDPQHDKLQTKVSGTAHTSSCMY